MVIIGIIGCLLILLFVHIVLKDALAPPFILSGIWLVAYVFLLIFKGGIADFSRLYYLSYLVGLIFFVIGFFLTIGNKNKNNVNSSSITKTENKLRFKLPYIQIFLLIATVLFIAYFIKAFNYILQENKFNIWHTLSTGKKTGEFTIPLIMEYSRSAIISLNVICSIIFFNNPSRKSKYFFVISSIIAFFYVFTSGNRGAIFLWIVSITFSYLIVKNFNNRKLLIILLKLAGGLLLIFILTNFIKYVYSDQTNAWEFSKNMVGHYFSSSTVAFVEYMKSPKDYLYGANTFRFFIAILKSIGFNVNVPELIQEEIQFYGDKTNVYTVLHYYVRDFGIIYAFFIQFVLGIFYGVLYKKAILKGTFSPFYIAVLSIFFFPLINQFFDDKYFSILSSWLQMIFWIWFFTSKSFLTLDELAE